MADATLFRCVGPKSFAGIDLSVGGHEPPQIIDVLVVHPGISLGVLVDDLGAAGSAVSSGSGHGEFNPRRGYWGPAASDACPGRRIMESRRNAAKAKGPRTVDSNRPLIGLTPDIQEGRIRLSPEYAAAVIAAGGLPVVLPPLVKSVEALVSRCQGIILTGGDDPIMEDWGRTTHPSALRVDPIRQAFDRAVRGHAMSQNLPVLGICFGMQLMGLECGSELDQHLPDSCPTASLHSDGKSHGVSGLLGSGEVHSRHHQALRTSGTLEIVAQSDDGMIEAVRDKSRDFVLGVQWHPERCEPGPLGSGLFEQLVGAARELHHATS